jgi:hypothetical protein
MMLVLRGQQKQWLELGKQAPLQTAVLILSCLLTNLEAGNLLSQLYLR